MRVAVTGSSGFIGARLVSLLAGDAGVERVIGVDLAAPPESHAKLDFVRHDVSRPLAALFRAGAVDACVHLAFIVEPMHDARRMTEINEVGTRNVLRACEEVGVSQVVCTSSAVAYGAHPDNPVPLRETDPLRANPDYLYSRHKLAMEQQLASFAERNGNARLCVLRPSTVLGPHVRNFISRLVENATLVTPRGDSPPWQITYEDDMARVLHHALRKRLEGIYNVGGAGTVTFEELASATGKKLLALPVPALRVALELGWRLRLRRLSEAPASVLPFLRFPWVVDPSKLIQETGFTYHYSTRAATFAFLRAVGGEAMAHLHVPATPAS